MKPDSNLTLNQMSLDDCSVIAPMLFPNHLGLFTDARRVVLGLDGEPSTPDLRRCQVESIATSCRNQVRRGIELRPAMYPHELAAAWLIWIKATDIDRYDGIQTRWPVLVGHLGVPLDYDERCQLLEFTSVGANAWHALVTSVDDDTLHLHRDITARVYPETRLWSPCSPGYGLTNLNTCFGAGFKLLTGS